MKLSISKQGISFIQTLKEEKVASENKKRDPSSDKSISVSEEEDRFGKDSRTPFNARLLPSPEQGAIKGLGVDARLVRRSGIKFTTPSLGRLPKKLSKKASKSAFNLKKTKNQKNSLLKFANYMNSTIQNRRKKALTVKTERMEPYAMLKDTALSFNPSNMFLLTKKKAIMKVVGDKRELAKIEKSIKLGARNLEDEPSHPKAVSGDKQDCYNSVDLGRISSVTSGSRLERMIPSTKVDRFINFQKKVEMFHKRSKTINDYNDFFQQIRSIEKLKKLKIDHDKIVAGQRRRQRGIRSKMKKEYDEINGIRRVKSLRNSINSVHRKISEKLKSVSKVVKSSSHNPIYEEWKRSQFSARDSFLKLQSNIGHRKVPGMKIKARKRQKARNLRGSLPIFMRKSTIKNKLRRKITRAGSSVIGAMSSQ